MCKHIQLALGSQTPAKDWVISSVAVGEEVERGFTAHPPQRKQPTSKGKEQQLTLESGNLRWFLPFSLDFVVQLQSSSHVGIIHHN